MNENGIELKGLPQPPPITPRARRVAKANLRSKLKLIDDAKGRDQWAAKGARAKSKINRAKHRADMKAMGAAKRRDQAHAKAGRRRAKALRAKVRADKSLGVAVRKQMAIGRKQGRAARKAARASRAKAVRPQSNRMAGGRTGRVGGRGKGSLLLWAIRKAIMLARRSSKGGSSGSVRNHGFSNSGAGGRTGRAGFVRPWSKR